MSELAFGELDATQRLYQEASRVLRLLLATQASIKDVKIDHHAEISQHQNCVHHDVEKLCLLL